MIEFGKLVTVDFNTKMKPYAHEIIKNLFTPSCGEVAIQPTLIHIDKECGIGITVQSKRTGATYTIQEKYRKNSFMHFDEFTQEYMNATGTEHQAEGEWFHLYSNYIFYGYANAKEDGFSKWVLIDTLLYKFLVEQAGGLDKIGKLRHNQKHGTASFYTIPLKSLESAIKAQYPN